MLHFKYLLYALLMLPGLRIAGQSISPEVLAASGNTYRNPNGLQLSWTMGEVAVENYPAANARLSLGFHQLYVQPGSVPTTESSALAALIRVSPNPTGGILRIENFTAKTLNAILYDATGRMLCMLQNIDFQNELELQPFPAGNYVLQFFSKNELLTSFKIVKQ